MGYRQLGMLVLAATCAACGSDAVGAEGPCPPENAEALVVEQGGWQLRVTFFGEPAAACSFDLAGAGDPKPVVPRTQRDSLACECARDLGML